MRVWTAHRTQNLFEFVFFFSTEGLSNETRGSLVSENFNMKIVDDTEKMKNG